MSAPLGKMTFTLAEAAELLSCHRETLRRAIRGGELRAAKLGREFRISKTDLIAFWHACGGGDLFGDDGAEAPPPAEQPAKRVQEKKKPQEQLTLPGTRPDGQNKG